MRRTKLAPTEVGTIYEVILAGDSDAERRGDREPVIVSDCEYHLRSDDDVAKCVEILRQSDLRLAADPDRLYDWHQTMLTRLPDGGGVIVFSVSWYDEGFFSDYRQVAFEGFHRRIYGALGVEESDFTVSHWRPV